MGCTGLERENKATRARMSSGFSRLGARTWDQREGDRVGWVPSVTSFTEAEKLQDLTYCHCPMDSAHLVTFNRRPGGRAGALLDGF
jgi:hypothetical protein